MFKGISALRMWRTQKWTQKDRVAAGQLLKLFLMFLLYLNRCCGLQVRPPAIHLNLSSPHPMLDRIQPSNKQTRGMYPIVACTDKDPLGAGPLSSIV
jgi:hypothetical protein